MEHNIWTTTPPTSYEEIRKTTIKGKHSVWENLPQVVGEVIHDHAYFSLVKIVEIFLGLDFECLYLPQFELFKSWYNEEIGNNVNQNDMNAAQNLANNSNISIKGNRLQLSGAIWHDDFDPSGSNKKNKNNAWITTFTFRKKKIRYITVIIHLLWHLERKELTTISFLIVSRKT